MNAVEVVRVSEDHGNTVRFGVVCSSCGVAWRARKVSGGPGMMGRKKSVLQRVSAVPRRLIKGRDSQSQPLENMRKSRSMNNLKAPKEEEDGSLMARSVLNLRLLSSEMKKGYGKQAAVATVQFEGLKCTCGAETTETSLCFQIVDWPVTGVPSDEQTQSDSELDDEPIRRLTKKKVRMADLHRGNAGFGSEERDQERGHQTSLIRLKGKVHPNPLMSCPVNHVQPVKDSMRASRREVSVWGSGYDWVHNPYRQMQD